MTCATPRWLRAIELVLVLVGLASLGQYVRLSRRVERVEIENRAAVTAAIATAAPDSPFIGELEIPRLQLSAAIRVGDDEEALDGAVGFLPDTSLPWTNGHTVLAAHRDRLFRPLADIRQGDEIVLTTRHGVFEYRVNRTFVVNPQDVWVLAPAPNVDLTLLTCYPFFYSGHAPQRFVVRAHKIER